jgi:hypothetical protein
MRCIRKRNIVHVEQIDENTYLVKDGDTEYTITKEAYERDFTPIN